MVVLVVCSSKAGRVLFKEFKEFAMKGSVMDLAVGVVIGASFGAIVTSFVNDLLMPPIGLLLGKVDFGNLFLQLQEGTEPGPYASLEAAKAAGAVTLNYGQFANAVISFLITAAAIFLVVKALNKVRRQQVEAPAPPEPSRSEVLLAEIRDLLKK